MSWQRRFGDRAYLASAALGATLVVAHAAGCSKILGVEDIDVDAPAGTEEAGTDGGGRDAGPAGECRFADDCPPLETTPAACAVADCVADACVYRAADIDQDGHPTATCTARDGTPIAVGDDCNDTNPDLYPGHPTPCAETEDGGAITFPSGVPVGACKLGARSCTADGKVSACVGAVGPAPVTSCTPAVDEACSGNPIEGCSCTSGQTTPCGTSSVGACMKGTATCQGDNTFGPCVGAVEPRPRDCSTANDLDCNGAADAQEAACQCTGGAAPGTSRACNTHPGYDGVGACSAGTQTCTASGTTSAWSACSGDVAPQSEQCDGVDRDCNGVAGIDDPAPPEPGGTLNCTHVYRCPAGDRGALYYRTGIGFTNYAGAGTVWTAYARRGDLSSGTYPPGTYRISHDATGTKMGPVSVASACCASGCPVGNVFFDGQGQFYTAP